MSYPRQWVKASLAKAQRRGEGILMNTHGTTETSKCPLYSEFVTEFSELERIVFPSAHTILLIAADASNISVDTISTVAQRFIDSGLIQVCVWGPDCERVHDIFDEVHVGDGSIEPSFTLMSFWHSDESLEEAIWYFANTAFPLDDEIDTTSYIAIAVGEISWMQTIEKALSDIPAFSDEILESERNYAAEELFLELDREENSDEPSA
jgi:hypothetical protein